MSEPDKHALARYVELLDRASFELRMAHDVARSMGLPFKRTSRLQRAGREVNDEKTDAESERRRQRNAAGE